MSISGVICGQKTKNINGFAYYSLLVVIATIYNVVLEAVRGIPNIKASHRLSTCTEVY